MSKPNTDRRQPEKTNKNKSKGPPSLRPTNTDPVNAMVASSDSTPSTRATPASPPSIRAGPAVPSIRAVVSGRQSASVSRASTASTDQAPTAIPSAVGTVQVPAMSSTRTAVPGLKPVSPKGKEVVKAPTVSKTREKKFVVLFQFQTTEKKYLSSAQKGDRVTVERWVTANQTTPYDTPIVSDQYDRIGLMSPFYLQSLAEFKKPNLIQSGRWFIGQVGPIEASHLFQRDNDQAKKGWFVVCEPPEYCSDSARWPELLMLVRTYNGSEKKFHQQFTKDQQSDEKVQPSDNLPAANKEPLPIVVYVRIRRKADGRYYIVKEPAVEPSFSLMTLLQQLYNMEELPLDADVKITPDLLTLPPSLMPGTESTVDLTMDTPEPPFIYGPRPTRQHRKKENMIFVDKGYDMNRVKLEEKMGDHGPHSLGLTYLASVPPTKQEKQTSNTKSSRSERSFRQVISSGLKTTKVHSLLGLDQKPDQHRPTCDAQLGVLVYPSQKNTKNICAKRIKDVHVFPGIIRQLEYLKRFRLSTTRGHNYLAKLLGYNENKARHILTIFSEWAGQCPLDCVLVERHKKEVPLATRGCLEVCYQVAAGMRFLEANELFHGQLSTSNIQAKRDMYGSMTIKLTDYYIYAKVLNAEPNLFAKVCSQKIPKLQWRCLAPEVLHSGKFTIKGDVWSFGIVMCEVFGHGKRQFMQFNDPKALYKAFDDNKLTLKTSQSWPAYVRKLISMSCRKGSINRPSFSEMWALFNNLLFDAVNGPRAALEKTCVPRTPGAAAAAETSQAETMAFPSRPSRTRSTDSFEDQAIQLDSDSAAYVPKKKLKAADFDKQKSKSKTETVEKDKKQEEKVKEQQKEKPETQKQQLKNGDQTEDEQPTTDTLSIHEKGVDTAQPLENETSANVRNSPMALSTETDREDFWAEQQEEQFYMDTPPPQQQQQH